MITLYIKTHNVTGLKYFGMTTKPDVCSYKGSGIFWVRHIKKHGYDVTTEIYGTYKTREEASIAAIQFSIDNNIVESMKWANMIPETAFEGKPLGVSYPHTEETKTKISEKSKRMWSDENLRNKIVEAQKNAWTEERKQEQSKSRSGIKCPEHSKRMKEKNIILPEDHYFFNETKTEEHKKNISRALTGKERTQEHSSNISKSLREAPMCCRLYDRKIIKATQINKNPRVRCSRIADKKEMYVCDFMRLVHSSSIK